MRLDLPAPLKNLRDVITIEDLDASVISALIDYAIERKATQKCGPLPHTLAGKTLTMIFQKPSLRTRLAFEVAMQQLGGHAVNLEHHQIGMGHREAVKDVARVTASMCDAIMARVISHHYVSELAVHAGVPVINGLSDREHPCEALANLMTLKEQWGKLPGRKLAFVGDGYNVARSVAWICAKLDLRYAIAAPGDYQLDDETVASIAKAVPGAKIERTDDPQQAVRDADVVYTDTWTSMGQESERDKRLREFDGYQVNAALLAKAKPDAVVLHCLPAYRNVEISDEVIDGPQSLVFQNAENRLHFQRALLEVMIAQE